MDWGGLEYLVVGAGLSGLTVARRLLMLGRKVEVIERRGELGGLAAAYQDHETGVEVHRYGTHVFHTKDERAADWIKTFCELDGYRHRVLVRHKRRVYPWPVNLQTINMFFDMDLSPRQAAGFLRVMAATYSPDPPELLRPPDGLRVAPPCADAALERRRLREIPPPQSLRDAAVAAMGLPLYEALVQGYSRKQWGCDPTALPADLAQRMPVRCDHRADLFDDPWQGLPDDGWSALFATMADGLKVRLNVDYRNVRGQVPEGCRVIYTGPLDEYFDYRIGVLHWRGVHFEREVPHVGDFQGAAVINEADERVPYTRTHEYKHLRPRARHSRRRTVIAREYPTDGGDPAYPAAPNGKLALRYMDLAAQEANVSFLGRLATYRYLNMDEAVVEALGLAETLCRT